MQFLIAGVERGERGLYITLSETKAEIEQVARSHGWDLSQIAIKELVPSEKNLSADAQLTVFNPSELELGETTEAMIAAVDAVVVSEEALAADPPRSESASRRKMSGRTGP